jgi:hypothetical protein
MVFKSEKSWLREGELSCLGSIVFENIRNIRYFSERENFIQIEYNTSAVCCSFQAETLAQLISHR